MSKRLLDCIKYFLIFFIFAVSVGSFPANAAIRENEIFAVGQILIYDSNDEVYSTGSAVVIDDDGHVLTNYHVIEPVILYQGFYPLFCITTDPEDPATCSFVVEIQYHDADFDLALLRITKVMDLNGEFHSFEEFKTIYDGYFPSVFFNHDQFNYGVNLGDEIRILGYPSTGGASVSYTNGSVSGFETFYYEGTKIPWSIKTDADIDAGNSGGAAFDANDVFIGVPTAVVNGYNSIGYITSIPLINAFLSNSGEKIGSASGSCWDLANGYFDPVTDECLCNEGYEWDGDQTRCVLSQSNSVSSVEVISPTVASDSSSISQCLDIDPTTDIQCSLTETNSAWINGQIDKLVQADTGFIGRLSGQILLQVEEHGEAWYVDPSTKRRYYMKDGPTAYEMMRFFGLGITNMDLEKVKAGNLTLINRLKGKILLQVEAHGEAYWIHPATGEAHYLKNGEEAYRLMRYYSLGITNSDLNKIPIKPFVPIGIETK